VRDFLLEEQKKYGLSIMFTSHNMPEVESVCDRVLFINSGKIIANDTPENLAKTLDVSKIHLLIKKSDHQKLLDFCKETNLECLEEGKYVTLEVKEKNIAKFLQDLTKKEILFDEISIDKPSLEDYFLHNARASDTKSFDTIT
jgi:ABC-2 type transport system ATP-binding protein